MEVKMEDMYTAVTLTLLKGNEVKNEINNNRIASILRKKNN